MPILFNEKETLYCLNRFKQRRSPAILLVWSAQGLDKFNIEKDIAQFIKKEFDRKHSPTWHCIVGRNFGEF